jgi:hypothetical protein
MIDSYELAMLPVTYMLGQADPFDRYCKGLNRLDEIISTPFLLLMGAPARQLETPC